LGRTEPNQTRTHVEKTHTELEPNPSCDEPEPEPSDPGSGWVRQIRRLVGIFAVYVQNSSAILSNVKYQVLVRPFRNSTGNKMALTVKFKTVKQPNSYRTEPNQTQG